jgi:hypothetical protein
MNSALSAALPRLGCGGGTRRRAAALVGAWRVTFCGANVMALAAAAGALLGAVA